MVCFSCFGRNKYLHETQRLGQTVLPLCKALRGLEARLRVAHTTPFLGQIEGSLGHTLHVLLPSPPERPWANVEEGGSQAVSLADLEVADGLACQGSNRYRKMALLLMGREAGSN